MAPTVTRLIALQRDKLSEIQDMSNRLKERDRASFNANIMNTRVDELQQVWNEPRAETPAAITLLHCLSYQFFLNMAFKYQLFFPALLVLLSSSILQPTHAVINGKEAAENEFPFIIDIRNGTDTLPFCGGTLVTPVHIVTAVYCVISTIEDLLPTLLRPEDLKVYVGSVGARKGQLYEVERMFVHPDYNVNVTLTWNNVAVIKLKTPVKHVAATGLPTTYPTVGQTVTLAGWGYTDPNREVPSTILRKFTLKVIDTKECKQRWETFGDSFSVITKHIESDRVFCAVPEVAGSGAGFGELGGPVVVDGKYVGISLLSREDDLAMPEVFVAVAAYRDFITKVLNDN